MLNSVALQIPASHDRCFFFIGRKQTQYSVPHILLCICFLWIGSLNQFSFIANLYYLKTLELEVIKSTVINIEGWKYKKGITNDWSSN